MTFDLFLEKSVMDQTFLEICLWHHGEPENFIFLLTKKNFHHRIQRNYKANHILPIITVGLIQNVLLVIKL